MLGSQTCKYNKLLHTDIPVYVYLVTDTYCHLIWQHTQKGLELVGLQWATEIPFTKQASASRYTH